MPNAAPSVYRRSPTCEGSDTRALFVLIALPKHLFIADFRLKPSVSGLVDCRLLPASLDCPLSKSNEQEGAL